MTFSETRVQPFYCPYCGEEDFVPSSYPTHPGGDDIAGSEPIGKDETRNAASVTAYHCRSCNRRFAVRFLGLGPAPD